MGTPIAQCKGNVAPVPPARGPAHFTPSAGAPTAFQPPASTPQSRSGPCLDRVYAGDGRGPQLPGSLRVNVGVELKVRLPGTTVGLERETPDTCNRHR